MDGGAGSTRLHALDGTDRKVSSQFGEDGVLEAIFATIGTTNRHCVEFGVGTGVECNTAHLIAQGWTGVLLDSGGVSENPNVVVQREVVTAENINALLDKYRVPQEFDLLSVDIDGNDYWVWKATTRQPRVVVIEYNGTRPMLERSAIVYDPHFRWCGTDYFGASLRALVELGLDKGYVLVYCAQFGVNAFFIRHTELPLDFEPTPWTSLYRAFYTGVPRDERTMLDPVGYVGVV